MRDAVAEPGVGPPVVAVDVLPGLGAGLLDQPPLAPPGAALPELPNQDSMNA